MPLKRYGTGFLKGLTNVAGQARADARADEDKKSRNALMLLQLAAQSDDPVLLQSALETLSPDLGLPTAGKGGKKAGAAGGKGDPSSMISQLLLGGIGGGGEGQAPAGAAGGQPGLRTSTPEETTARGIAKTQQLDEATIARLRQAGVPPEQIATIMQQLAGAPAGPTGFAPAGSVPFTAGVPGEQIPPRPLQPRAPANLQLVQRNRPGDPEGAPPSDFLFAPDTGQLFNMDRTPVAEALETRRAPLRPTTQRFQPRAVRIGDSDEAVQANYDSLTGQYTDLDTGEVLKNVRPAPTAEQRNKAAARKLVVPAIDEIRTLSESVIQHVGPRQRAEALRRGAAAVLGNDPEWRTYRDARRALAGNLAVLQQGSRPSDADISAVWLPLVPDVFTDTTESAAMKWRLIRVMSGLEVPAAGAGPAAGAAPTNPFR